MWEAYTVHSVGVGHYKLGSSRAEKEVYLGLLSCRKTKDCSIPFFFFMFFLLLVALKAQFNLLPA